MAQRTAVAWLVDEALFFEAGTGVGKSLAYLIPGLVHALQSERPLIVSTHTIALQEQILNKDLPLCKQLFRAVPELQEYADFKPALMLGKANYLCGTRLRSALARKLELFPDAQQLELTRIADWARYSQTGLRKELDPPPDWNVWEWVQADAEACNRRNCTAETCAYRRAWEQLRTAHVIVVNHSLLFSLLAAGHFPGNDVPGILLPGDFLVLDEAHTVAAVATDYLGMRLNEAGLSRQLNKLYNRSGGRARGLLARHGDPGLRAQVGALQQSAAVFWSALRQRYLSGGRPFRMRVADWAENPLDQPLRELIHGLQQVESRLPEGSTQDELIGVRRQLDAFRCGLIEAIGLADSGNVYWLESGQRSTVELRSAPLDIAGALGERLFRRRTGVLLTSATLAEGSSMDSLKRRLGAPHAASQQERSPFDYPLQMGILLHGHAPTPGEENHTLDSIFLAKEILRLVDEIEGGTLVLFTSYRDLLAV
jgi:ATP-dependent DNA helicase DinG